MAGSKYDMDAFGQIEMQNALVFRTLEITTNTYSLLREYQSRLIKEADSPKKTEAI